MICDIALRGIGVLVIVVSVGMLPVSASGSWLGYWVFKVAPRSYCRDSALTLLFRTGTAVVL